MARQRTPLTEKEKKFDLKFLLCGNSGVGKTHFCGSYTQGPIHFYMTDPGGEKTLHKLNSNRTKENEITVDTFSLQTDTFQGIWKIIQQDAKDGFFNDMAAANGLVVLPDSLTTLSMMAVEDICKAAGRDPKDPKKSMQIKDWGIIGAWLKELMSVLNSLPCAVASTAHLHMDYDNQGAIVNRAPMMQGKLKYTMGLFFDEVYLLENRGLNRMIHFKETNYFEAKTRTFINKSVTNITMDDIASAYINNTTELKDGKR